MNARTWMTTAEAGDYARTSAKAIRNHLEAGDLAGSKVGRIWLVNVADLEAWIRHGYMPSKKRSPHLRVVTDVSA